MAIEDTFIPVYYRVEISATGLGGSAPKDGFIDNLRPRDYDPFPSTRSSSEAKERGNIRYEEIIRQLSTNISPVNHTPRKIVAPGRDADSAPTEFNFTVVFDRPEYLRTEDENNPGVFLTGEDAVKRFVARALVTRREDHREIFDPETQTVGSTTLLTNPQQILLIVTDSIANDITTAEGNITVNEIDNT